MSDYVVRATAEGAYIRAFAATTNEMVEFAKNAHNTSPVMTAALGRLLTAGAMMGVNMKGDADILTLRIEGDGPGKGLVVTADSHGNVKGYPYNPEVLLRARAEDHKLDVKGAIGNGSLQVIMDVGLKEPYVGQVELISGEIAEDLTYYYAVSEQISSSVGLGVLMNLDNTVNEAGGFIIQLMPGAPDDVIERLEQRLAVMNSVTSFLQGGKTPEEMLDFLLGDMDLVINDKLPIKFYCNCSKERVAKALISVGDKELKAMVDDGEPITVNCHFCNSDYTFDTDDLAELYRLAKS